MTPQLLLSLKKKATRFRTEIYTQRQARLQKLADWIQLNDEAIITALSSDFKKPRFETIISEISPVLDDIKHTNSHLKKWMRDKKVSTPSTLLGHSSRIRFENKGVVLVIAPWNYPFQLAICPLVAALSAGNSVVIKPSELTPHTSNLIKKMILDCFSEDEVTVELGAKEKTQELLGYDFDHVFFTGSTQVGRIVAKACADRLIPVTLELGGKSPTIVDETADLNEAAEKVFWGKYLNRGQSCIAPDYILVQQSIADQFVTKIKDLAQKNTQSDMGVIISESHHQRLQRLAGTNENLNTQTLKLVEVKDLNHESMKEEVFGPVLPILRYNQLSELENLVVQKEKPLALYIFSKNRDTINWVLSRFTSGGAGVNSVLLHFANHNLPFGGVGASGNGRYHGHYGFLEMSHQRGIIEQKFLSIARKLLLPPYTKEKYKILDFVK
jgi:aldehyde dehydrogenase (NAD+)